MYTTHTHTYIHIYGSPFISKQKTITVMSPPKFMTDNLCDE